MSEKIIRDPVHDVISFRTERKADALLFRLLNAAEVQRLRRIRQLGMANLAYPAAEHTRYSHSLGVMETARKMLARVGRSASIDEPGEIACLAGLQADWFDEQDFYRQEFSIAPASNRMGLRLQGEPLKLPDRELVSEPVAPGAVQVTSNGQCIVLAVDGQTIGGYPKIAHVIQADLDRLGQLRPDDRVRFVRVTPDEALALYRQQEALLRHWVLRFRAALGDA